MSQFTDLTPNELAALNFILQQQQKFNYQLQPNKVFSCEAGLERLYYHTATTLPIHANEIDVDSDEELDPDWLKEQTTLLINEFADVNEGEKGLMRLWNLHCLKNNFIADFQVYEACETFIAENKKALFGLGLLNNFSLHLANLFDYGLLKLNEILKLTDVLYANQVKNGKANDGKSLNQSSSKKKAANGCHSNNDVLFVDEKSKASVLAAAAAKNNTNGSFKSK